MNIIYLISQIIGFTAFVISLIAYHRDKKEKIFKTMVLANLLDILHYFLLGAYSGCLTKLIALVRNRIIIVKEKSKKLNSKTVLIILLIIYLISAIITYENIYSVVPILSAIIYLYFAWNADTLKVKKVAFYCYFLWLLYNICVLSISGVISNCVSIISTFIAIYKHKSNSNREKKFD